MYLFPSDNTPVSYPNLIEIRLPRSVHSERIKSKPDATQGAGLGLEWIRFYGF